MTRRVVTLTYDDCERCDGKGYWLYDWRLEIFGLCIAKTQREAECPICKGEGRTLAERNEADE